MIDRAVIRDVLARVDIGAYIGTYLSLHKRGRDLVGLCPFHAEKTPSFYVHPDRGFFKCFGCGAAGNPIDFHMKLENVPFPEAVRALAKRVGVEIEPETPAAARARSEKEAIYAVNAFAADFFARMLRSEPIGEPARAYCRQRDVRAETIEAFKIGYAPPGWQGLTDELQRGGFDLALAAKAGLVKQGQRGYYDFYRGRLMIPTASTTGEIVAFGGRSLDGSEPKYLNTAGTPVYTKGRGLFALNVARRAAPEHGGAIVVVEGYLDCVMLHQAGFRNTVASLGTAFTSDQAAELRKYAERLFLCFDGDAAGEAATMKSIELLVAAGLAARIVRLEPGSDPDSYVRAKGAAAFQALLDAAPPWIEYRLDRAVEAIAGGFTGASEIAREAESLVRSLPREEWDRWRVYVASRLGLSPDDLRASSFLQSAASFAPRSAIRGLAKRAAPIGIERDILMTLLDEPTLIAEYAEVIPLECFKNEAYRALYGILLARRGEFHTLTDVFAAFSEDRASVELLVGLQKADRSGAVRFADTSERRAHLDRIVEHMAREAAERRRRELEARIAQLFSAGQQVPKEERDEYQRLVEEREQAARRRLGAGSKP